MAGNPNGLNPWLTGGRKIEALATGIRIECAYWSAKRRWLFCPGISALVGALEPVAQVIVVAPEPQSQWGEQLLIP